MESQKTRVVHVRHEHDVYIGRKMPGKTQSEFANPFRIGADGNRTDVIEKYEDYIKRRLADEPALYQALQALKGKRLGCWCKPAYCHGDVLAQLLDGPETSPSQTELF